MSSQTLAAAPAKSRPLPRPPLVWIVGLIVLAGLGVAIGPALAREVMAARPHAPDWSLIAAASPAIKVHIGAVLAALGVGGWLLAGPKGKLAHRILGWTWTLFMLTGAASSLFIRTSGGFSFLHLFSLWVLAVAPIAVHAARTHNVARHRRSMTGLYIGGLVIAGTLTFLPGRLMWNVFLG